MSSEVRRKCFKCDRSPRDCDIKLYRFPKPGSTNILKCELWAKFCFPEGEWFLETFQNKLHAEHRMLCDRHFEKSSFLNYDNKVLDRQAVPSTEFIERSMHAVKSVYTASQHGPFGDVEALNPVPSSSQMCMDIINNPSSAPATVEPLPGTSQILTDITNIQQGQEQHSIHAVKPVYTASQRGPFGNVEALNPVPSSSQMCMDIINNPSSAPATVEPLPGTSQILTDITNIQQGQEQKLRKRSTGKMRTERERHLYVKCRKNMKKVCELRNKIKKFKKINTLNALNNDAAIDKLSKDLTPSFALLLQGQLRNLKRKYKGRRWTMDEKIIALRLYKRSPTCYRLLRRLWCLPAPSTLKSLLGHFKLEVGVNEKALAILKKFIDSHQASDNEFVLMWDEMSIKKHLDYNKKKDIIEGYQDHGRHGRSPQEATHGLVFMVAGIRKKVKQPIAYFLSSSFVTADRLAVLIKEVLHICFEVGVSISATVCDMDGVNRRALGILGATQERPYFDIDNKQVVNIFDPPHLLKCFRNLFLKYDIKCAANISSNESEGQGIAKWSHIQQFYEMDNCNPNFVFAPTLRKDHLNPNVKQKMKVNLAAQVLSHSVAAGMFAKISQGELTSEALVTAGVIGNMDKLFDCLNSDNPDWRRGKPYATNLSNASPHIKLFEEMKRFFRTMEFIGCRSAPSQQGWIWTLNAIEQLWKILKNKHQIKSLATRRLQQDPLENLFGCIRSNCGSNCNPSTGQFIAALKTAILGNLAHVGKGNCEADNYNAIMNSYKDILGKGNVSVKQSADAPIRSNVFVEQSAEAPLTMAVMTAIDEKEGGIISDESSGELQACAYVCGFLIKNIKNECRNCEKIFCSGTDDDLVHLFNSYKEYSELKKSLNYASSQFINCVEQCATLINIFLKNNSHLTNLRVNVAGECEKSVNFGFLNTCKQHSVQNLLYIINSVFYICVKRFCVLKNRIYSEAASQIRVKKKINIIKHI